MNEPQHPVISDLVERVPTTTSTTTRSRTAEGESISSRDHILPGEEEEYALSHQTLVLELAPAGILEQLFVDEIMTASWRLRRCRIVESTFAEASDVASTEDLQRSVDRARAQSHNIIRRATAELRRLQTERTIRAQLGTTGETPGLADTRQIHLALKSAPLDENPESPSTNRSGSITLSDLETLMAQADKQLCAQIGANSPGSFCKTATPTPIRSSSIHRNAPCPCKSGRKYKKCCGNPAAVRPATAA